MTNFLAVLASSAVGLVLHVVVGERLSMFEEFGLNTVVCGVVYVWAVVKLKALRGE